LSPSIQNPK